MFESGVPGLNSASIDRTAGIRAVDGVVVCTMKCSGVIPPPVYGI
jgi:hypothetical protein